jgi:uncharacterized protein YutE (UPF0331/DUF86 family)
MTNRDLLEKKLAFIERALRELRTEARPEQIERELREQRFVERQLQLAIQAALVHGYVDVDPAIVRDVVEHHLGDLDAFVAAIRLQLAKP